jgi:aspartyl-tRNA(Asn)/glutamyl-tRNA(Gln) amidotransferase subunit A
MPLSWSLDHPGPMARTVRDVALLLGVMAGADPHDATTSRRAVPDYTRALERPIAGLRVGVPATYFWDGVDAGVAAAVREAIGVLGRLGARVADVALPDPRGLVDAVNLIARCEGAAVHARLVREQPHALQPAVLARMDIGFQVSAYEYLQATRLRAQLARGFIRDVFAGGVHLLAMPTIPEPAPALEAVKAGSIAEIVRRMGRFSRLTRPWNGLGLPALSVPCGFSGGGLPIGLQLVGRPFDEATVLRAGHAYEQAAGWWRHRPSLE